MFLVDGCYETDTAFGLLSGLVVSQDEATPIARPPMRSRLPLFYGMV